jgi:hypothetical protein
MKTVCFIFCLLLLSACNDSLRTRVRPQAIGDGINALSSEGFRKMYIAEVTTPIIVGQSQMILKEAITDSDFDFEYICDIDVAANKQFSYIIQDGELILKDGISTLIFTRLNGSTSKSLLGTWRMKDSTKKVLTVTELIFNTLDDLKIRKTCKLL